MNRVTKNAIIGLVMLGVCSAGEVGTNKTLVSWICLADTVQRGGSALTIQRGDQFDAIVLGEREAGKWMAGSDSLKRTQNQQGANAIRYPSIEMVSLMPPTKPATSIC